MKYRLLLFIYCVVIALYFGACNSSSQQKLNTGLSDTSSIGKGRELFFTYCSTCHHLNRDGIGPQLAGITDSVDEQWLHSFINNPKRMLDSGDERTEYLVSRYKAVMPAFDHLGAHQISELISFIRSMDKTASVENRITDEPVEEAIPGDIPSSGIYVEAIFFAQLPSSAGGKKGPAARITKLDYRPGDKRLFVADMRGKLYALDFGKPAEFLDLSEKIPGFVHEPGLGAGLGSFAFHPEYLKNGILYTAHSEKPGTKKADFFYEKSIPVTYQYVLTEWRNTNLSSKVFSGTSRELLRIDMVTVQHGIQEISFNPYATPGSSDYGNLFVCIGDGGALDDKHYQLAGSSFMPWGTVLRINPLGNDSKNGQYSIPADNPFVDPGKGVPEIFAYGFRNPHRISWTPDGQIFVANIGEAHIESVYKIKPGAHHGWPIREGTFKIYPETDVTKIYRMNAADSTAKINYPVAQYDHDWGYAGVSGGFVYTGKLTPQLRGKYAFGDIPSGKLFLFDLNETAENKQATVKEWFITVDGKKVSVAELCGSKRADLHFGRDADSELYMLTKADGKIYKLGSAKNLN